MSFNERSLKSIQSMDINDDDVDTFRVADIIPDSVTLTTQEIEDFNSVFPKSSRGKPANDPLMTSPYISRLPQGVRPSRLMFLRVSGGKLKI